MSPAGEESRSPRLLPSGTRVSSIPLTTPALHSAPLARSLPRAPAPLPPPPPGPGPSTLPAPRGQTSTAPGARPAVRLVDLTRRLSQQRLGRCFRGTVPPPLPQPRTHEAPARAGPRPKAARVRRGVEAGRESVGRGRGTYIAPLIRTNPDSLSAAQPARAHADDAQPRMADPARVRDPPPCERSAVLVPASVDGSCPPAPPACLPCILTLIFVCSVRQSVSWPLAASHGFSRRHTACLEREAHAPCLPRLWTSAGALALA